MGATAWRGRPRAWYESPRARCPASDESTSAHRARLRTATVEQPAAAASVAAVAAAAAVAGAEVACAPAPLPESHTTRCGLSETKGGPADCPTHIHEHPVAAPVKISASCDPRGGLSGAYNPLP
eukprot:scaffold2261_cov405-Prasinococcus_capsulatus_cf.AAC.11